MDHKEAEYCERNGRDNLSLTPEGGSEWESVFFEVDWNTLQRCLEPIQSARFHSVESFPEDAELIGRTDALAHWSLCRETPPQDLITPHRDRIEMLLKDCRVTAKQVLHQFNKEKGTSVEFCMMKHYIRTEFQSLASQITQPT